MFRRLAILLGIVLLIVGPAAAYAAQIKLSILGHGEQGLCAGPGSATSADCAAVRSEEAYWNTILVVAAVAALAGVILVIVAAGRGPQSTV